MPENIKGRRRSSHNYAQLAHSGRAETTALTEQENSEAIKEAESQLKLAIEAKQKWLEQIGFIVKKNDFIKMANDCAQSGYDYYQEQFNNENGRLYHVKKAFQAASVFDPYKLVTLSQEEASLLLSLLKHFKFPEFTPQLHTQLVKEFTTVKEQAEESLKTNSFSDLPGASDYDRKLETRKKKVVSVEACQNFIFIVILF